MTRRTDKGPKEIVSPRALEVPAPPSATLPTELPPPLVVPPSRLTWALAHGYGRPIAHAFVAGSERSVCRGIVSPGYQRAAEDGAERCHECRRILGAQASPEAGSVPNLEG